MRRVIAVAGLLTAIAVCYGFGRYRAHSEAAPARARRILYYVDPMHPTYKSAHAGVAPDCGMALEPVFADEKTTSQTADASRSSAEAAVTVEEGMQRRLGIRVAAVERSGASRTIHAVGRVAAEDTRVYRLNAGVDGLIRETYDDSVGTLVRKDQKIATYYAPEFLAAASGFLAANERIPGSVTNEGARSIQNYSDRLRNLGMSDVQINAMAATKQLPRSIDVVAPVDGFIVARNVSPGQHFDHAMDLYRIADLSRVWVLTEVDEQDASFLRPGGAAEVTIQGEHRRLPARITGALPQSEAGGGTVKVRVELENPQFMLRPEMLVDVEALVRLPAAITVPMDALVDTGRHERVYVDEGGGRFVPREVETGWRFGDRVEILRGVKPGERVVAAATFLVDSESRLQAPGHSSADLAGDDNQPVASCSRPKPAMVRSAEKSQAGTGAGPQVAQARRVQPGLSGHLRSGAQ